MFKNILGVTVSAQWDPDPDPTGFINPESRPKVGIQKFGIRDPESVRDPLQSGTIYFFCGLKATRDIIMCKYF
jgi:hypothetical protein